MLIRNTLIVAGASFALAVGCFAGVAAIAGPEFTKNGWTFPVKGETGVIYENGKVVRMVRHTGFGRALPAPSIDRTFVWAGEDELRIDLPVDVVFVQGADAKIVVSGPKAYVDRLRVVGGHISLAEGVEDDYLGRVTISPMGVRYESEPDRVKITIIAPNVTKFDVRGSGDLDIRKYDHPTVSVSVSGSGDVEASGRVETISVDNSGSGYVDLAELKARDAMIDVSGSGGGAVFATGKAKIEISGSGDVELRTEPKMVTSEITGSGEVRREY
jgi:carbon monoxide dehydrogenase subunit G